MGDIVLTDTEISPVMKRLSDEGVEITAIHNHLIRTSQPVFYMHIGGQGDPVKYAQILNAALALSKTPMSSPAAPVTQPSLDLDTASISTRHWDLAVRRTAACISSACRAQRSIAERGMTVPPAMGTAIAINFQPTGAGKAAITGDFVLLGMR